MEDSAKLITALAALLSAIAWPGSFLVALLTFKKEVRSALAKIPVVVDRMKNLKLWAIETELEKVADQAAQAPTTDSGLISADQVTAAAKIKSDASGLDDRTLLSQLDRLCIEYDTVRRVMQPGTMRTRAMTQILVRMRALGPSVSEHIDVYKSSGSAGSRLAAVAMMQMQSDKADVSWLTKRFREDAPFVFYHAALAFQNLANDPKRSGNLSDVKAAAAQALQVLRSFEGEPDAESIFVLEALLSDKSSGHYV